MCYLAEDIKVHWHTLSDFRDTRIQPSNIHGEPRAASCASGSTVVLGFLVLNFLQPTFRQVLIERFSGSILGKYLVQPFTGL